MFERRSGLFIISLIFILLPSLSYGGLRAFDAEGKELSAGLEVRGSRLLVRVCDMGARCPVVLDPMVQQAVLTASDGSTSDDFGCSVSVSGDGNTMLIGACGKTLGANEYQGAAYVFVHSGTAWSQQARLTASDGAYNDAFGYSVSLSSDGNTALVGAPGKTIGTNLEQGGAYVFTRSGTVWTQQTGLTASNGATGDSFGDSVSLSSDGNTFLIGAYQKTIGTNFEQGAAYVFAQPVAAHLAVVAPASAPAGTAFNFTVTAMDASNKVMTGYTGIVHFTSTDATAVLPANTTLTNGTGTFSATLKTAGTAFNFTVTAMDASNKVVTGYTGIVHFTSTDATAVLPANTTLTNGTGTFSATLKTAGSQTITATDTLTVSFKGISNAIAVSPAAASRLRLSAPATAKAGKPITFAVKAVDAFRNIVMSYTGTIHFTSTDATATLPADAALTNGIGTFSAALKTAGSQTVTATDETTASITGTTGEITVRPAAATHFQVKAPASVTARVAFQFIVKALDQFNNRAASYTGKVHFMSTDEEAKLPADSKLTTGKGTFSGKLKTAGINIITVNDKVNADISGASNTIDVQ